MSVQTFTRMETACIICIAAVGGCIPALQPLLLGGLLSAGKLSASQLGQAAMLEGLGMAVSATLAGAFLRPERLRQIIAVTALVALSANVLTVWLGPIGVLLARAVNGLACGILLWLIVGLFARCEVPARLFAIYVTAQAALAFALSAVFAGYVLDTFGVAGSYLLLALINLMLLFPVLGIPGAYALLSDTASFLKPTVRGFAGLWVLFLFLAGIMGFWVYVIPIGVERGFDQKDVAYAVSFAIALQIAGGLAAAALASRIDALLTTALAGLVCAAIIWVLTMTESLGVFYVAIAAFSFCWMFTPPFHMPFMIHIDPSRQSAMFLSSAQLLGVSLGPMICAFFVSADRFARAASASMLLFVGSSVLALALIFFGRSGADGERAGAG